MNLVSVSKITNRNHEVIFIKDKAIVQDSYGEVKMIANRVGDLYYIREVEEIINTVGERSNQDLTLWHQRMGHLDKRCLLEMVKKERVTGINIK